MREPTRAQLLEEIASLKAVVASAAQAVDQLREMNFTMQQHANMIMERWVDCYRRLRPEAQQDHDKRFDGTASIRTH